MTKFLQRVSVGLTTAALLAGALAPAAFAGDAIIDHNGAGSNNKIKVDTVCVSSVTQTNNTKVTTNANPSANSGGNNANGNTGSGVTIDTGNADASVTVEVGGSSNSADPPSCCDCGPTVDDMKITDNGVGSTNKIKVTDTKVVDVLQRNRTRVRTTAHPKAKTGKNNANGNTGGTVGITTDNATASVDVSVDPSSNSLP